MKAGFDSWMYSLGSVPPWVKLLQVSELRLFNCNEAPKKEFLYPQQAVRLRGPRDKSVAHP